MKIQFLFLSLLGFSPLLQALDASCKKVLLKRFPDCQRYEKVKAFSEDQKNYLLIYSDCKQNDFESSMYLLVSKAEKNKPCEVLDFDTSFVGYIHGVDSSLKSNQPPAVYQKAILAELNHQLKKSEEKKAFLEKLKLQESMGELSEDLKWVLKNFGK